MLSKRVLKSLPFHPVPPEKERVTYVKAEKHRLEKQTVLSLSLASQYVIYYWDANARRRKRKSLIQGQLFLMEDGFRMLLQTESGAVWSAASLKNSEFPLELCFTSKEEEQMTEKLLKKWGDPKGNVHSFQTLQRNRIRAGKYLPEIEKIRADMELFGKVPKGYPRFIRDKVLLADNYLFFNRKDKTGYCTYCGSDFTIPKEAKHNTEGTCPCCKKAFIWKSEGVGRGSLTAVRWSLLVERKGDAFLCRYFRHIREGFADFRNLKEGSSEIYRVVIRGKEIQWYEAGNFKNLNLVAWEHPKRHVMACWQEPSEWWEPTQVLLYNRRKDLKRILEDPEFRFSGLEVLAGAGWIDTYAVPNFLSETHRKPQVEKLLKCGFYQLAFREMNTSKDQFADQPELHKVLGVSKESFRILRGMEHEVNTSHLRLLSVFERAFGRAPKKDEWKRILQRYYDVSLYNPAEKMEAVIRVSGGRLAAFWKLDKYLADQNVKVCDYEDYLRFLTDLEIPLTDFTRYPRHFKQAHDLRAEEVRQKRDEIEQKKLQKFEVELAEQKKKLAALLKEGGSFKKGVGGLMIRLPESLSELSLEGATLHHCVATYKNLVMEKKTTIFFIRKLSDPDTPFYTLEWRDGKVKQCRGYRNCDPTPQVRALVDAFEKKMKEKEFAAVLK